MSERKEKGRFGLSPAEIDNLKGGVQYILTIVLAVTITFLILAVGSNMLGI
jgi:hypothetical protein